MLMPVDQLPVRKTSEMRLKPRRQILAWLALAAVLVVCPASGAVQDEYILRCSPTAITGVVSRHAMTLIRPLDDPTYGIYLVRGPAGAPLAQYLSEVSADPAVAAVEPNADVVVPETPPGLQLNQSTASILDALASPMNFRDTSGMDIAVIENGPTAGNPIGHTSIAITGQGVYSFGNNTRCGSSLADYLRREAPRRNTVIYIIKTTPAQDALALAELKKYNCDPGAKLPITGGSCSNISNNALTATGIPHLP